MASHTIKECVINQIQRGILTLGAKGISTYRMSQKLVVVFLLIVAFLLAVAVLLIVVALLTKLDLSAVVAELLLVLAMAVVLTVSQLYCIPLVVHYYLI